jgi:hypothetical protein
LAVDIGAKIGDLETARRAAGASLLDHAAGDVIAIRRMGLAMKDGPWLSNTPHIHQS